MVQLVAVVLRFLPHTVSFCRAVLKITNVDLQIHSRRREEALNQIDFKGSLIGISLDVTWRRSQL